MQNTSTKTPAGPRVVATTDVREWVSTSAGEGAIAKAMRLAAAKAEGRA